MRVKKSKAQTKILIAAAIAIAVALIKIGKKKDADALKEKIEILKRKISDIEESVKKGELTDEEASTKIDKYNKLIDIQTKKMEDIVNKEKDPDTD